MKVLLYKIGREITSSIKLIEQFQEINKTNTKIKVKIDYDTPDAGYYYDSEPNNLYVNPSHCNFNVDCISIGYTESRHILSTIIHEFAHLLDHKYEILYKYEIFTEQYGNCLINDYCETNLFEEIAELIVLYITNPYLLYVISIKHYNFFKQLFKSPTSCGPKTFIKIRKKWDDEIKQECCDRWGINVENDTIQIIEKKKG